MESIFRGLAADLTMPEGQRRHIIVKIFQSTANSPMAHAECTALLKLLQEWILVSDNPFLVQTGLEQFSLVSRGHISVFYDFINPNKIIDVFTNPLHQSSRVETIKLVGIILDLLNGSDQDGGDCGESSSRHELDELRRSIVNVARPHLFTYLREYGVLLPVALEISRVYQRQPAVLPNESDYARFATLVVNLLAGYRKPTTASSSSSSSAMDEVVVVSSVRISPGTFSSDVEEVSRMLPLVWGRSEATDGIEECLKAFYAIISTEEDPYNKPSCALLTIVDKVTQPFLLKATQAILEESGQHQGEAKTVVALQTMIEWLTQERSNLVTSEWILNMLQKLKEKKRNSILMEIAHASTEKLLSALLKPDLRPFVEQIFFFLLLGFQHSESAFHSIVAQLPRALAELGRRAKSELVSTTHLLNRLAEAAHFLMIRFPGFPELYNPVQEVLQELGIRPPDEARFGELKTLSWTSLLLFTGLQQINSPRKKRLSSLCSLGGGGGQDCGLNAAAAALDEQLELRSETGMVGLINLGNTCYMNSVLQALYITKNFCNSVLGSPVTPQQLVLHRLQFAFSFLRDSQRSIYSPAEFLKAARPPWFEAGRQQDCSEFLRYLLDTLHEQEKSGHGKGGAATYGEHRIIKTASPPKDQQTDSNGSSVANGSSAPASPASSSSAGEDEPARLKRASNSALDVISEVPEIRKEEVDNNDEDERMSQGSGARIDDDYFGSRSSVNLSKDLIDGEDDDVEEDEEEDIGGSRASLGSAGLKRWTTEGNLSSYDGSREGKMDLLDGPPIHDSHSNSTDSGIQSVGDSIRGSSDSVTNTNLAAAAAAAGTVAAATTGGTDHQNGNNNNSNKNTFTSLVQTIFGGKMQTSYKCAKCNLVSQHKECFTDINLAIPEAKSIQTPLTVQSLVLKYLEPELLENDNKYQCDRCQGLQEAVKSVSIIEGPQHLMCTLMRFKYDRAQGRKSKIFTEVDYELSIELPIGGEGGEGERTEKYGLYAAVVHSGYSSDGGHYYTYGREDLEDDDYWYVFNDSKVSHCSFEDFRSLPKRFSRDTAYVLFYRKRTEEEGEMATTTTMVTPSLRVPLRPELRQVVERDNLQFLREKERSSYGSGGGGNSNGSEKWRRRGGDNDDDSGGGSSPGGCGGGGFNAPGRLVC